MTKKWDEILSRIAMKDDASCFEELFRHFFPGAMAYAKSIVGDETAAADLIQELFLKIWANRKTLTAINSFPNYLYTALKHNAINYLKLKKRITVLDVEQTEHFLFHDANPETRYIQQQHLRQVEETINALPHRSRQIFRLIKEDGMKYKEVAQLLNLSVKTVEAHMSLAYGRIIECFEKIIPEQLGQFQRYKKSK